MTEVERLHFEISLRSFQNQLGLVGTSDNVPSKVESNLLWWAEKSSDVSAEAAAARGEQSEAGEKEVGARAATRRGSQRDCA